MPLSPQQALTSSPRQALVKRQNELKQKMAALPAAALMTAQQKIQYYLYQKELAQIIGQLENHTKALSRAAGGAQRRRKWARRSSQQFTRRRDAGILDFSSHQHVTTQSGHRVRLSNALLHKTTNPTHTIATNVNKILEEQIEACKKNLRALGSALPNKHSRIVPSFLTATSNADRKAHVNSMRNVFNGPYVKQAQEACALMGQIIALKAVKDHIKTGLEAGNNSYTQDKVYEHASKDLADAGIDSSNVPASAYTKIMSTVQETGDLNRFAITAQTQMSEKIAQLTDIYNIAQAQSTTRTDLIDKITTRIGKLNDRIKNLNDAITEITVSSGQGKTTADPEKQQRYQKAISHTQAEKARLEEQKKYLGDAEENPLNDLNACYGASGTAIRECMENPSNLTKRAAITEENLTECQNKLRNLDNEATRSFLKNYNKLKTLGQAEHVRDASTFLDDLTLKDSAGADIKEPLVVDADAAAELNQEAVAAGKPVLTGSHFGRFHLCPRYTGNSKDSENIQKNRQQYNDAAYKLNAALATMQHVKDNMDSPDATVATAAINAYTTAKDTVATCLVTMNSKLARALKLFEDSPKTWFDNPDTETKCLQLLSKRLTDQYDLQMDNEFTTSGTQSLSTIQAKDLFKESTEHSKQATRTLKVTQNMMRGIHQVAVDIRREDVKHDANGNPAILVSEAAVMLAINLIRDERPEVNIQYDKKNFAVHFSNNMTNKNHGAEFWRIASYYQRELNSNSSNTAFKPRAGSNTEADDLAADPNATTVSVR